MIYGIGVSVNQMISYIEETKTGENLLSPDEETIQYI